MPIKPEDIDPSKLPVAFRGYDRAATDDLLKRVAWDYRQASRVQDTWTEERERLKKQIQQLEAQVTSQQVEFTRALTEHEATIGSASSTRSSALEAEVAPPGAGRSPAREPPRPDADAPESGPALGKGAP